MSMSLENGYPKAQLLGVEDFTVEDFRLSLMCDKRYQASYLGGSGGEKSKVLYLGGSGERSQNPIVGWLDGGPLGTSLRGGCLIFYVPCV